MWKINHNRLKAAAARRDRGEAPMLWDNVLFSISTERPRFNSNKPISARPFPAGSNEDRTLNELRERPFTVADLSQRFRLDEADTRKAIDDLRKAGWWLECDGDEPQGRFYFVPITVAA